MKPDEIFATARAHHQQGRIAAAEAGYRDLLQKNARHVEALALLGAITLQDGRAAEALKLFDKALEINPSSAVLHSNRALTLRALGRKEEALGAVERALALRSDYPAAIYNRALVLHDLGRFGEALGGYDRAIALEPRNAKALNNRGVVLQELKQYAAAAVAFERALALEPRNAEFASNRGVTLRHLGEVERALDALDLAIACEPGYAAAHYNRALVLQDLKRPADAFEGYQRAVALKNDYPEALNNRGLMLRDMRRNEEALADFDAALAIRPEYVEALNNRGAILQELHHNDEALATFTQMLALESNSAPGLNNRGHAFRGLGRYEDALASYDQAVALDPHYAEAQFNASLCRLLLGQWEEGWQQYESRWHGRPRRGLSQPLWLGDQVLTGKTILLHAEQGFGDTLQMARYIKGVAALGAKVILEVQSPLKTLMSGLTCVEAVIATGDPLPPFDLHCPLMSLPLAFKTAVDTVPRDTPYLHPDPALVAKWQTKLGPSTRMRIGLAWSGSGEYVNDYNRSVLLTDLEPLLSLPFDFVSLQKEIREHDKEALAQRGAIGFFGEDLTTFAETAALAQCVDLVISVDTAVAHMSGALGRPTCILLKYEPDWRWLLDRPDSVWYPTARLFRQRTPGKWSNVVDDLVREVQKRLLAPDHSSGR